MICFCIVRRVEKEDFLENSHFVLLCLIKKRSFEPFVCFWIVCAESAGGVEEGGFTMQGRSVRCPRRILGRLLATNLPGGEQKGGLMSRAELPVSHEYHIF